MSTKGCQEPITSIQTELKAIDCNVRACLADTDAWLIQIMAKSRTEREDEMSER